MPYSKIPEYGIAFIGLPPHLEQDIGTTPRKPALYGSAQRRELWQSRDVWSLTNNLPTNLPADASPSAIEPVSGLVSSSLHSSSSILHSSSDSVTNPLTSNPVVSSSLNSSASILNPSTSNTSISTSSDSLNSRSLSTPSVSNPFTSNFIASNSLDFSSSISNPSTSTPPVFTSSALRHSTSLSTPALNPPISVTLGNLFNSRPSFSKPSAFSPRTSGSFTSASSSLVSNAPKPVSFSPGLAASSPATLASLHAIHKTNAIRVPKDMLFGLLKNESNDVQAIAVVSEQTRVHGKDVGSGNVVVQVRQIINPGLHPSCPGAFDIDEPVAVGAFYEWPCDKLALLRVQNS